jgi:hypothetical protein
MKALIIFSLLLIGLVLGHDAWLSHTKDLPFALSDFGWVLNTYVPQVEEWLIEMFSSDEQATFITPIFKMETLWVISILMGGLIALNVLFSFRELAEGISEINLNPFKKTYSAEKILNRDTKKSVKYKRK